MNQTIKKRIEEINNGIVPEGYEKTSFGIFPCDWEKDKSLGDICEINPKTEALPNEFIYIDLESVVDGKLIQENVIENAKAPSRAQRVLQKNDIIYQMVRPYQKNNFIFIQDDGSFKYVASTGYAQLRSDNYGFLYQMVNSEYFCTQVLKKCTGTNYPAINSQDLAEVNCACPKSDREQSRIAEILMQWDKAIELHEKLIEAYQKSKKYYLNKMFPKKGSNIPEIRFPGFTAPWEQRKLSVLCEKFTDGDWIEAKDQSNSGVRLIQTGNIGLGEYLDKPNNKKWISEDTFNRLHCEEVCPGDILISRLPEPAGRACIMPNLGVKMITAVDCTIVRVAAGISKEFLLQHLSSPKHFNEVNTCMAGGTRQRISRSNLANFGVLVPTLFEEQELIGGFLCGIDNLITLHQQKRDKLVEQRKAMQQYLLTGIVRV